MATTHVTTPADLTDEQIADLLREAQADDVAGRLVRCTNPAELRAFLAEVRAERNQ